MTWPRKGWEGQGLLDAPLDSLDEGKGPATRAAQPVGRDDGVAELIADQRLSPAEQDADQQLLTRDARGHGSMVAVHHLGDDQVLEQMQAGMELAFGRDAGRLGGRVDIEGSPAPGLFDPVGCRRS
jgi:hypothetical protein